MSISCVSFRGGETAGSAAYRGNVRTKNSEQPTAQAPEAQVNFRGYDEYGQKKKSKAVPIILGVSATAVAAIIGMGYAHKTDALSKLSDGKIKDFLSKTKPMLETCDKWCTATKDTAVKAWEKVKGWFGK